ncbi:MAG: hypothetical protein V2B20_28675 [Pseudomonadota bacterium]
MKRNRSFLMLSAVLAVLLMSAILPASIARASGGDEDRENWFEPQYQVPKAELLHAATSHPGIVQGGYWRIHQFLAYRMLTGHPLTAEQVEKLNIDRWRIAGMSGFVDSGDALGSWLKAREAVPDAPSVEIKVYFAKKWTSVVNCRDDAFYHAAATLANRLERGGVVWAAEWLQGQDAVFSNCSGESLVLPAAPPPAAPAWLKDDRRYQQAAARFYNLQHAEARRNFLAIAEDTTSSWNPLAAYLAARTLTRKVTLECDKLFDFTVAPEGSCREDMMTAEGELASLVKTFSPARGLLGWVRIRLHPKEWFDETATLLAAPQLVPDFSQDLVDYLLMYDVFPAEWKEEAKAPFTQWIYAMQASVDQKKAAEAFNRARDLWRKHGEEVWLLPMAIAAPHVTPDLPELTAMEAVAPTSPAYMSIRYYLAKLAIHDGRLAEARGMVDDLLHNSREPLTGSVKNRLAALQLQLAETAGAFFAAAPRRHLKTSADSGENWGVGQTLEDDPLITYARDAVGALNWIIPLEVLQPFALRSDLPAPVKEMLPEAVWTRAVLLGNFPVADKVAGLLEAAAPVENAPLWQRYGQAEGAKAKEIAAMLILVNTPEFHPYVSSERDSSHYWWCSLKDDGDYRQEANITPQFIKKEDAVQAAAEQARLSVLPNGTDYLAPFLLARAQAVPGDPDIPKALHLLVQATKGGCISEKTSGYSQQAFRWLHKKHPQNEWTKKTPYHY